MSERKKSGGVWHQHPDASQPPAAAMCVCLWRACMYLWSPRTCRLSAAGCGSQLSGELREREEAR